MTKDDNNRAATRKNQFLAFPSRYLAASVQIPTMTAIANRPAIGFVAAAIDTRQSEINAAMIFSLSNRPSGAFAINSATPQNKKIAATQSGEPSCRVDLSQGS